MLIFSDILELDRQHSVGSPIVVLLLVFLCSDQLVLYFVSSQPFELYMCFTVMFSQTEERIEYTDNHLHTDTRYNDQIPYNDNLTTTKPSLKR